jgi:hypothetical protein
VDNVERADKVIDKLQRVAFCLCTSSVVVLLMFLVVPEHPPLGEAIRIWLYSHFGPLLLFPYMWPTGLLTLSLSLALILPTLLRRSEWFVSLCTGGFLLRQLVGLSAIIASI